MMADCLLDPFHIFWMDVIVYSSGTVLFSVLYLHTVLHINTHCSCPCFFLQFDLCCSFLHIPVRKNTVLVFNADLHTGAH